LLEAAPGPKYFPPAAPLLAFERIPIVAPTLPLRLPRASPAGSFLGGFRTTAALQTAPSRSTVIRNPAQKR
jgi:hypothetical protein